MAPKDKIQLPFRWRFVPIPDPRDKYVRWTWRAYSQTGDVASQSRESFETLSECMEDAKANGFGQPK